LTTSVAKDGGSWVLCGFLKQHNITTAKAGAWFVGSVPNPKNASFAAVVSTEILPMILNDTVGKINKNDVHVHVRDEMFCSNFFFYTRHDVRRVLLILPCQILSFFHIYRDPFVQMKDSSHQYRRWHQLKQVWMMRRRSGVRSPKEESSWQSVP
jgi:hypothetical protein